MVEAENPLIIPSNEIIQPVEIVAMGEERKEHIVTDRLHQRGQVVWNDLVELGYFVKSESNDGGWWGGLYANYIKKEKNPRK